MPRVMGCFARRPGGSLVPTRVFALNRRPTWTLDPWWSNCEGEYGPWNEMLGWDGDKDVNESGCVWLDAEATCTVIVNHGNGQ